MEVKVEVAAAVIMRLNATQSSLILNEMSRAAAVIANIIASASDPNTSAIPMKKRFLLAIAAVAVLAAGCQSPQAIKEIGRAPAMSPIGSGLAYGQTQQMSMYPKQPRQALGYSLERLPGDAVQGRARSTSATS